MDQDFSEVRISCRICFQCFCHESFCAFSKKIYLTVLIILQAQTTKTSNMIKVSFAENPLLNETQVLGRLLSFFYLCYFWKKRLRTTNFQQDNEIALVTRRNGFAENAFYWNTSSHAIEINNSNLRKWNKRNVLFIPEPQADFFCCIPLSLGNKYEF